MFACSPCPVNMQRPLPQIRGTLDKKIQTQGEKPMAFQPYFLTEIDSTLLSCDRWLLALVSAHSRNDSWKFAGHIPIFFGPWCGRQMCLQCSCGWILLQKAGLDTGCRVGPPDPSHMAKSFVNALPVRARQMAIFTVSICLIFHYPLNFLIWLL